jgi:thiamine transport system substrate-binding protein
MVTILLALALITAGCGGNGDAAAERPDRLTVLTHSSFEIPDEVIAAFEDRWGIGLSFLDGGDAGLMVNQAILTKDNPIADVIYGVDNTFLSRALDAGIFAPYRPPALADVPDELELDPSYGAIPIDYGDVCINYDREVLPDATAGLVLEDLTGPGYAGRLVVQDPASSSPGLAFLLATIARFPDGSDYPWQRFWADLRANDVLVVSGWEEAYGTHFTRSGGDRPLVVSYASSPPVEVLFGEYATAPTGVVTDGCFRQIEFAGVLAGTGHEEWAEKVIDWMLSAGFQEAVPLNMFVFPASTAAVLPEIFVAHTTLPADPLTVAPAAIDVNREAWIEEWTEIVLR